MARRGPACTHKSERAEPLAPYSATSSVPWGHVHPQQRGTGPVPHRGTWTRWGPRAQLRSPAVCVKTPGPPLSNLQSWVLCVTSLCLHFYITHL